MSFTRARLANVSGNVSKNFPPIANNIAKITNSRIDSNLSPLDILLVFSKILGRSVCRYLQPTNNRMTTPCRPKSQRYIVIKKKSWRLRDGGRRVSQKNVCVKSHIVVDSPPLALQFVVHAPSIMHSIRLFAPIVRILLHKVRMPPPSSFTRSR